MELANQEYIKINGLSLIISEDQGFCSSQLLSKHIPMTHGSNGRNSSTTNCVDNILQSGNCTFSHHLVSFLPILTKWVLENREWNNAWVCKLLWICCIFHHSTAEFTIALGYLRFKISLWLCKPYNNKRKAEFS